MKRKGVSGSPGLVDFANGLMNSVLKLREVWGEIQITEELSSILLIKKNFNDSWVSTF